MNHHYHQDSSNSSVGNVVAGIIANKEELNLSPSHLATIQTLQNKVQRVKKRIADEQRKRDENVEEYLKMAAVAQRNQLPQVKALFEKRNTKAATHIAGFQRKLERYEHDLENATTALKLSSPSKKMGSPKENSTGVHIQESEASGGSSNASSYLTSKARNVGHGIKTVISKPKEIASYLLKQKFGSADNIVTQISRENENRRDQLVPGAGPSHLHHGSAHITSESRSGRMSDGTGTLNSSHHQKHGDNDDEDDDEGSAPSSSLGHHDGKNASGITSQADFNLLIQHLNEIREEISSLRDDLETFKNSTLSESSFCLQGLQEERFRAERLEEQVNDLTELHQAETCNLKQALADAEEKLSYQSEERLRDIAEMLEACQTKISRLEQQQQQLVTIEGIENSTARHIAVKLVNVGLTLLQLILLMMATFASALGPFLGSRSRIFFSVFIGLVAFIIHRKWKNLEELAIEFSTDLLNRL